jgi:hypothetical protein
MALFEHKITATGAPRWLGIGNIAFAPRDSPALVTEEWERSCDTAHDDDSPASGWNATKEGIKVLEARYVDSAFMLIHTDKPQFAAFAEDVGKFVFDRKNVLPEASADIITRETRLTRLG